MNDPDEPHFADPLLHTVGDTSLPEVPRPPAATGGRDGGGGSTVPRCPRCGVPMRPGAPGCLSCLLRGGLEAAGWSGEDDEAAWEKTGGAAAAASPPAATASHPTPPGTPPRRLGHYEVAVHADGTTLWELGRGSMGVTFRAVDTVLHYAVALKVIDAEVAARYPDVTARFLREARAAAQLRHPNVASVFHFGEQDGQPFYAMELVEGETLEARVRRDGPLPAALVVEVGLQVARALAAAESRGLVHRDLKPSNLMVVVRGDGGGTDGLVIKVIDFGLAKAAVAAAGGDEADLTRHGGFVGTPAFASPEQFHAKLGRRPDARTDIYSLGATLWYLLTGKVPFDGGTLTEIHDRQVRRPLPVARLRAARVPGPVVALLRRLLAVDPADRPQNARELGTALTRCRETLAARARRRRRRGVLAAVVGALVALAAVTVFAVGRRGGWDALGSKWPPVLFRPSLGPTADSDAPTAGDRSIAVLPLENLSEDKENAFFADGLQDDVIASLAKIHELKVISRTSVLTYRDAVTRRNLREIGRALDVAHVLEGSVRRAGDRVLVNVHLVDTREDRQVWTQRYDRTLSDALTLQGELAQEIAGALRATLSPEEKARVENKPTENADAYVLYLRARDYQTRASGTLADYLTAAQLYGQAIALDPSFALARARLASTLASTYQQFQPTAVNRDRARAEAEMALRLQPTLGEGHLARAQCLYWLDKNYEGALRELTVAARLLPSDSDVGATTAYIQRRQGRWREALDSLRGVLTRDPRNGQITVELSFTAQRVRDWPAAAHAGDRAVVLAPELPPVTISRRYLDFWAGGDLGPLNTALTAIPPGVDPDGTVTYARWDAAMLARDFAAAERVVTASAVETASTSLGVTLPKPYLLGCAALARGDEAGARALFETARPAIEAAVRVSPQDADRHGQLGVLYAYLGRREDALREGRRAVELLPGSYDAIAGRTAAAYLALILARTGETDEALAWLEHLLTTPGPVDLFEASITQAELRARWQWDPLRADARFQRLLAGPEPKTAY